MISCGARLAVFDIAELREVTAYDELELDTLGDRKTALFLIMSDTDDSFNFLISMCYTQLFNLLCEKADDVYDGRLPVHVRCLIDECANIGQIPKLEKLVATIRSREISACLVLQAQSQLKAIYKDNADTIIGNMDTSIFLGGKEPTTLKELAAVLGKETINIAGGKEKARHIFINAAGFGKVAFHLSGGIAAGRQSKIREGRGAWSVRRGCSLFPCEKFNGFGEALAEKLHDKINGAAAFALAVAIPFVSPDGQAVVPFPAVFLSALDKYGLPRSESHSPALVD